MSHIQQKLFGGEAEEQPKKFKAPRRSHMRPDLMTPTPLIDPETLDKTPNEEYLKDIRDALMLWDMRCWDKRSREEAAAWVKSIREGNHEYKNCGHVHWCIKKLLNRGVEESIILDAIMANEKIQYRNRLVRCFGGESFGMITSDFENHPCPRAREAKGYTNCNCEACEDPKDVERNYAKPRRKPRELAEEATGTGTSEQHKKAA